jgi:hypothetical protein
MQWAAGRAKVVNMSLGGPDTDGADPLEEAVNTLTAQTGTLFVIASGNDGLDNFVSSPASADAALAVGAVDKQDQLASFSNRGPRAGDGAIKPDITAPGVDIVAALSKDSAYPEYAPGYTQLSGTSMATPHVAGAAAILASEHPQWSAGQLKAVLMATAKPNPALNVFAQGAGRVDVARAVTQSVHPSPSSLWLGTQPWPAGDDEPVSRTVTLHNDGTEAKTLDLTVQANAPAAMFTVEPARVTVPAGGTADVVLTADTRVDSPSGMITGALVGDSLRVPIAIEKGFESRTLTISHLDRTGALASNYATFVVSVEDGTFSYLFDASGKVNAHLRIGRYHLASTIVSPDGSNTMLVWPTFTLDADTSVTMDARRGKPLSITVPRGSARSTLAAAGYIRRPVSGFSYSDQIRGGDFGQLYTAQLGPLGTDAGSLTGNIYSGWAEPGPNGDFTGTPYEYRLAYFQEGSFPTGFVHRVRERELATVKHEFHSDGGDRSGVLWQASFPPEGGLAPLVNIRFPVPGTRTVYYTTAGQQWRYTYMQLIKDTWTDTAQQWSDFQTLRAGRRYVRQWQDGPLGVTFNGRTYAQRMGNVMRFNIPPFSDQNPLDTGYSLLDTGATGFSRNGVKIVDLPTYFYDASGSVPPAEATYRWETTVDRSTGYDASTVVHAAWTFRSAETPKDKWYPMALMAMRFLPGTALGGCSVIPLVVSHQDGTVGVKSLTVEVSYDDGKTWRSVSPRRTGIDRWQLIVARAASVSLRATATDKDGNTAEYSVLRGYHG